MTRRKDIKNLLTILFENGGWIVAEKIDKDYSSKIIDNSVRLKYVAIYNKSDIHGKTKFNIAPGGYTELKVNRKLTDLYLELTKEGRVFLNLKSQLDFGRKNTWIQAIIAVILLVTGGIAYIVGENEATLTFPHIISNIDDCPEVFKENGRGGITPESMTMFISNKGKHIAHIDVKVEADIPYQFIQGIGKLIITEDELKTQSTTFSPKLDTRDFKIKMSYTCYTNKQMLIFPVNCFDMGPDIDRLCRYTAISTGIIRDNRTVLQWNLVKV